jgi:hypothetical protein
MYLLVSYNELGNWRTGWRGKEGESLRMQGLILVEYA